MVEPAAHVAEVLVVRLEEAHAPPAQAADRPHDVARAQRDVLHARAAVRVEVLLDLAALQPGGRLVQRHRHAGAVRDHRRAEGAVLGGDLVLVEVAQLGEAERLVERHPLVELADLDVADDVVDAFEADRRAGRFGRQIGRHVAGAVVAEVVAAVDERVLRLAVRADRGEAQRALVVGQLVRLAHRAGTAGEGRLVGRRRVVDDERQVLGTVTVLAHVGPDRRVGREAGGDDETDVALFEQVRRDVVATGLRARRRP